MRNETLCLRALSFLAAASLISTPALAQSPRYLLSSSQAHRNMQVFLRGFGIDSGGAMYLATSEDHIVKMDSAGQKTLYDAWVQGARTGAMKVDPSGNVYLAGTLLNPATRTAGAWDGGCCGFAAKISPTGQVLYVARLGPVEPSTVAFDAAGNILIAGNTIAPEMAVTSGTYQTQFKGLPPNPEGFVMKLNSSGSALAYSTFLGGNRHDVISDMAVDGSGNAYLCGSSTSTDYPVTPGAWQSSSEYDSRQFVTKLNTTGTAVVYSTLLRDSVGMPYRIALDGANAPHLLTSGIGGINAVKLTPGGDGGVYATQLVKAGVIGLGTLALDSIGNAYASIAIANTSYFPASTDAIQPQAAARMDAVLVRVSPAGAITYATFLGGTGEEYSALAAVAGSGRILLAGETDSTDFPLTVPNTSPIYSQHLFLATLQPNASGCPPATVSPGSQTVGSLPSQFSLTISTSPQCVWTAVPASEWLAVGTDVGVGNGTTVVSVATNSTETARTGDISVNGTSVAVTQSAPACIVSVSPLKTTVSAGGGDLTVSVGGGAGCPAAVTSNASWVTVAGGATGTVPQNVVLRIAPNTGVKRIGTVSIGYQTVEITQPPPCSYGVAVANLLVSLMGGHQAVVVQTEPQCSWTVTSLAHWITLPNGATFTGSGSALLQFAPNDGSFRTGAIRVAGELRYINQAGLWDFRCGSYTLDRTSASAPYEGSTGTASLGTGSLYPCDWHARSNASWLEVSPISGSISTTVQYTVAPNFSSRARSSTIQIADKVLTITQAGNPRPLPDRTIQLLYYGFLGRLPSDAEIQFQRSSQSNLRNLPLLFFNAEEFNMAGRFVAGLYVGILERDAEFGGWIFQRRALTSSVVNAQQIVKNFIDSPEFSGKYGHLSSAEFVRLLYRNILLRDAGQAEVDFQANNLVSRQQLAANFLNSREFRIGFGPRLTAFLLYATLLQRSPSASELATRIAEIEKGSTLASLIDGVLVSAEFQSQLN